MDICLVRRNHNTPQNRCVFVISLLFQAADEPKVSTVQLFKEIEMSLEGIAWFFTVTSKARFKERGQRVQSNSQPTVYDINILDCNKRNP